MAEIYARRCELSIFKDLPLRRRTQAGDRRRRNGQHSALPHFKKGKAGAARLPDFILALHFDSRYDYRKDFQPEIPVLDVDISICNDFKKEHYNFSHEYLCEMLEAGERYGEELCKELFTGDVSREGLQKKADEIFLREHGERQRHISVDRLFSMLNTIGKLLRRDAANIKKLY